MNSRQTGSDGKKNHIKSQETEFMSDFEDKVVFLLNQIYEECSLTMKGVW